MNKRSKYIIGAFIIVGAYVGIAFIAPYFKISEDIAIPIGMFLSFLATLLVPNLWKSFLNMVNEEHKNAIEENRYLTFWKFLTHPTQLPGILGIVWGLLGIAIVLIFRIQPSENQTSIWLIPIPFLFGLGCLLMAIRREYVRGGLYGYVVTRSNWMIFWGILGTLFCWGGGIYFTLAIIYKW